MKKSILLGAAALAAVTFAGAAADAGEVKIGGYYMFRLINADSNVVKEDASSVGVANGADDMDLWSHRLQLNLDMKASEKSHAHARIRVIDSQAVSGADTGSRTGLLGEDNHGNGTGAGGVNGNDALDWDVKQLWLETEAWGVGVKVGEMPVSLNDNILVNHDTTSFGTIMLSKSFGDITVVGAVVKVSEENISGMSAFNAGGVDLNNDGDTADAGEVAAVAADKGAGKDDVDLYALSLLGKGMGINYQATLAYLKAQSDSNVANALTTNANDGLSDWWLALTLNSTVAGIDLTGTLIYEAGMSNVPNLAAGNAVTKQFEEGDFLVALRAKGKTGFGGWNAYAFYAGEDFTNISNTTPMWSETWDTGGPFARDLMNNVFGNGTAVSTTQASGNNGMSSPSENVWGVGAGLTINAGGWTIRPMLDYAAVVETDLDPTVAGPESLIDSAWGGSLVLSTNIQQDTVLSLTAQYVKPDFTTAGNTAVTGHCAAGATGNCDDSMHQLMADIKMTF
ncbi:MAG: hypothetical protein HQL55_15535 [Magnetococcales bacterium]|nr:hypothetical protein [Magnetococcales bacterium]